MMSRSGIVIATSIPPSLVRHENGRDVGQEYQNKCIDSWIAAGFRVLSVNFPGEIPELALRYPKVNFTPVAEKGFQTPILRSITPAIDSLLSVLAAEPEDVAGIINADICLEAGDWTGIIRLAAQGAVVVGHRIDIKSFDDRVGEPYINGYDFFFFERNAIPGETNRPFAMGRPWWDYYLPIAFRLRGSRIKLLTSPAALHLQHPTAYEWPIWRYMAKEFAEFILESLGARKVSIERELIPLVRLCRKIASGPNVFEDVAPTLLARKWDGLLNRLGRLPGLSSLKKDRSQDANRIRLSRACVEVISHTSV